MSDRITITCSSADAALIRDALEDLLAATQVDPTVDSPWFRTWLLRDRFGSQIRTMEGITVEAAS